MAGLKLTGISKRFGGTPVLRQIDLDFADGAFLTLVGPSVNSVRIARPQRDIINAVMRGTKTSNAGIDRIVKEGTR